MDAAVKKIMTDLKAKKYAPVYFLQGEETFYIDLIADFIEAHVLNEAEKGFNQVVVYGKDVTMATILTHARRFPMMAERQVVIVKEAQDIQDLGKDIGGKLLLDYLGKQVPTTVLVFCHKHKSLDKRKEVGKKIDQLAVTINSKKLYDNQLPEFVSEYVKDKKIPIEDRAIQAICEFVGNDLHRLANEIDKLVISLQPGESITADKVMNQVGVSKEYNIFELQKAIVTRDTLLATKIVNYFESNTKKNPSIPVVAYLFSFFSKLLMASSATDKSEKGLVSELKVSPYAVRDYTSALRIYPMPKIMDNISSLREADLKLKGVNTGAANEGQILRELVWRLMN
ncbi:DNA polymerase III subunit delta [Pseudochryseolinea flava]|uniref:DNA polymerase III subunit delta n=2 Tax=Pseudochryseolinea flava TaxID=2059302 RepID=A0A364XW91_9BACT|nr:DNA polymerase III subunit delta [Pseudochryseolinea flava]